MSYVDGFVVAVPKNRLDDYKALAKVAGEVAMELGATGYVEALGDNLSWGKVTSFPRAVQATEDEVVVFSWILYKDRESKDAVMEKFMVDPRLTECMKNTPFDMQRMVHGGFEAFVEFGTP